MKKTAYQWSLKVARLVGHPVSFAALLVFVLAWVAAGRMSGVAGLLSIVVLSAVFWFRTSEPSASQTLGTSACQWALKMAWVVGHPASFVSLLMFVLGWVVTGRMSGVAGVLSIAILGVIFGFRASVLVSHAFVRSPLSVLGALGTWSGADRFAARSALVKDRG